MAGALQNANHSNRGANYSKQGVGRDKERGCSHCSSHSRGAALMISRASPQAEQKSVCVPKGASHRPCGQACLCLSPPCQDEPEAHSAPHPPCSYPVFPMKEIWASGTEKQRGSRPQRWGCVGAAWAGDVLHTCTTRQVPPQQHPLPPLPRSRRLSPGGFTPPGAVWRA